jgi:hypothetical protein
MEKLNCILLTNNNWTEIEITQGKTIFGIIVLMNLLMIFHFIIRKIYENDDYDFYILEKMTLITIAIDITILLFFLGYLIGNFLF